MRIPLIYTLLFMQLLAFTACENRSKPKASDIIEKAIIAYGGETNLRNIQSRKEIGTTIIYINDSVFRTTRYRSFSKSPNKSYYESPINQPWISPKLVFASDGEVSWTQNDGALAPYLQPPNETINRKGEDYPYLFTLQERGVTVSYVEQLDQIGRLLHHLKYIAENGFEEEVYFDDDNGLIVKTYKQIQTSIGPAEVIQLFNDYRKVGNVMIPFRVESQYPPREIDLNIINELAINEYVNDSIFQFPSPLVWSKEEKMKLIGTYTNGKMTIIIEYENDKLWIQKDDFVKTELLVVQDDFFMFRIGANDKSHVENIQLTSDGKGILLSYKNSTSKLIKN